MEVTQTGAYHKIYLPPVGNGERGMRRKILEALIELTCCPFNPLNEIKLISSN